MQQDETTELGQLAKKFQLRLEDYVYRTTLDRELAQDITQECLLAMVKVYGNSNQPERFWPWLRQVAHNKIRDAWSARRRHQQAVEKLPRQPVSVEIEGLQKQINAELQESVNRSISQLSLEHRQVINLRCYENMDYAEIARIMDRSEFATRMLFWRARRSLQKQLVRHGLGKGALVMALVVFGKLSAQAQASTATLSTIPATLKVGGAAALAATATTKLGLTALGTTAVTILAVGVASSPDSSPTTSARQNTPVSSPSAVVWQDNNISISRQWFYYPLGSGGPVMLHFQADGQPAYCSRLTNTGGHYFYDAQKGVIKQVNHGFYHPDLAVLRLPTDSPELTQQLDTIENHPRPVPQVLEEGVGLSVMVDFKTSDHQPQVQVDINSNALLIDETFSDPWPVDIQRVDARDPMHKRGWTFFTISGQINGQAITGAGRLPFIPAALEEHFPWLKLNIGSREFAESLTGTDAYRSDSLFTALGRPWMGLHTIDTIRRDAATRGIYFETQRTEDENLVKIELSDNRQSLIYTVHLSRDVIESIEFFTANRQKQGELRFDYADTLDQDSQDFSEPDWPRVHAPPTDTDYLWIMQLIQN